MKKKYLLIILQLIFVTSTFAQEKSSDLKTGSQIPSLKDGQILNNAITQILNLPNSGTVVFIPIKLHIVRKSNSTGGISLSKVNAAINQANIHFLASNLQFYLCDAPHYINNSVLSDYDKDIDEARLITNNVNNAINLYIVDAMTFSGYTYYPSGLVKENIIVLRNAAIGNGATLSNELGHYFSLYNTYETIFGAELVARINCTTTGDLLCDTPADPNGTYNPSDCSYTGLAKDGSGANYTPLVNNIMSNNYFCRTAFTAEQISRINAGYSFRTQQMTTTGEYTFTCPPPIVAAPTNLNGIFSANKISLTWIDNSNNETGFTIERSNNNAGPFTTIGSVNDNITTFDDINISSSTTYYYRVRASNSNIYTNIKSVTSGTIILNYCTPSYVYNCSDSDGFNSFIVNGSTMSNGSGCSSAGYGVFTTPVLNVTPGLSYNFSGTLLSTIYNEHISIWIDINNNGVFDSSEKLFTTTTSLNTSFSGSFTIPANISLGNHRLRLRCRFNSPCDDPCISYSYGETEDYFINVIAPTIAVNNKIDNMGYWNKLINYGIVSANPYIDPPKADYLGNTLLSSTILSDLSPDVAIIDEGINTQSEISVFAGPEASLKALNANNSYTSSPFAIGVSGFETEDYGSSWSGKQNVNNSGDNGDPAAAIGLDGKRYNGYINPNGGMSVAYSSDGINWNSSVVATVSSSSYLLDKNHLMIDNSIMSPYKNNLYNVWTPFLADADPRSYNIEFSRSTNSGINWSAPILLSTSLTNTFNHGVNVQTGPTGQVYVAWVVYDNTPDITEDAIGFAKSTDGGVTFTPAVRAGGLVIQGIREIGVGGSTRVNSFPSMAIDNSDGPYRGNVYITWANIGVPGVNTGNDADIYMIRSTNGGTSWSAPIKVSTASTAGLGKKNYQNWITCDPITGTLSCIYYSNVQTGSQTQMEAWVSNSFDGGTSWGSFRISDVKFIPTPIPGLASGYFGDYLGISAYNGIVYPVWCDNRSGRALAYTSPYAVGCIQELALKNKLVNNTYPQTFKAQKIKISPNGGSVNIETGTTTDVQASSSITFENGFYVKAGAVFSAKIGSCNNVLNSLVQTKKANQTKEIIDIVGLSQTNYKISINNISKKDLESESKVVITDLMGEEIIEQELINKSSLELDLKDKKKGIFLIKVFLKNQTIVKKLIFE